MTSQKTNKERKKDRKKEDGRSKAPCFINFIRCCYCSFSTKHACVVLVGLYEAPKKPESAIDFIKEYLGASMNTDADSLKTKVEEQNKALQAKDKEIAELNAKIASLQANNTHD